MTNAQRLEEIRNEQFGIKAGIETAQNQISTLNSKSESTEKLYDFMFDLCAKNAELETEAKAIEAEIRSQILEME